MCCHNGRRQQALYESMFAIDPSLPSPSEFFHLKGRESDGGTTVSTEEAEKALDAVFLAAISGGTASVDDEDWADVDADDRLDQHIAWMRARTDLLNEGLTSGMVAALGKYVTDKHAAAEAAKQAEIEKAVRERGHKTSPRAKAVIGALSLLTLASMTSSSLGTSNAAPDANQTGIEQHDSAGPRALEGQTFNVGGRAVYIGAVKGKCAPGTIKIVNPKTQKLNWKKTINAKVTKRVIAKGATICKFTKSGQTVQAPTNAAGAITALPSNFPKNPTAADIANLGLTKDSKVSPNLRLPEPTGAPIAPAQLAQKVRPVGVVGGVAITNIKSGIDTVTPTRTALVEWEITGGSGVLTYSTQGTPGGEISRRYTKLNPSGVTRVTQVVRLIPDEDGRIMPYFHGAVEPDFGQANLPSSTVDDWTLPAAKDKSGVGMPVGVNANPGFWDQYGPLRDGWAQLTNDGTLVGNYNY